MIVQRIKPYRQPQFDAPSLELNGKQMTITNPKSNGDFALWFDFFIDGEFYYSARIKDNAFSSGVPIKAEEVLYSYAAKVKSTNVIRSSGYSNVENVGKLSAPVMTIEGEKLVLYNPHGFSNASDIDIYINGEYVKTISAEKDIQYEKKGLGYYRCATGEWVESNIHYSGSTNLIPVCEGDTFIYTGRGEYDIASVLWYDAEQNFISGEEHYSSETESRATTVEIDVPSNASYARFQSFNFGSDYITFKLICISKQIEIAISDLITTGYNTFNALAKNDVDTRWLSSELSNGVKRLEDDVLYLSVARNSMASGTVGNYAVFAGGLKYNSAGQSGVVEAYDETLTHITASADLSQYGIQSDEKSANAGDYLIIKCNGAYCVFDENLTLQILSGDTVQNYFAGSISDCAIFAGGYNSGPLSEAFSIDKDLIIFSIAPLSVARYLGGSANTKNHLVFCGGTVNASFQSCADAYDESLTLVSAADMASAKMELCGANAGGYAVFAGGGQISSGTADGFAYDENLALVGIKNLTVSRTRHAATSCRGSAVFAGNGYSNYTDVVEIYSDELVKTNRNIPVAKAYIAMASINELCLIAGGRYDKDGTETTSNTVDVLLFD